MCWGPVSLTVVARSVTDITPCEQAVGDICGGAGEAAPPLVHTLVGQSEA
jgi:hypothetical protein